MTAVRSFAIVALAITAHIVGWLGIPSQGLAQTAAAGNISVFLGAGLLDYSLGVDGQSVMLTGKAEGRMAPRVIAEGGVSYARIRRAGLTEPTNYWIGEIQVHAQYPLGRVAPYVGAGGGVAVDFRPDSLHTHPTASVALGVRAWVSRTVALRAELRARGVGSSAENAREGGGHTREFVFGMVVTPPATSER